MPLELEAEELRAATRRLLADRKHIPSDLRPQLVAQGWLGLAIPEAYGGLEQPFSALAVLYVELGRVLANTPFASTSLCLDALAKFHGNDARVAALIQRTLAGEAVLACVLQNRRPHGVTHDVLDAGEATHLLIPFAEGESEPSLAVVALPNARVSMTHRHTWDETRRIYDVELRDPAPAEGTFVLHGAQATLRHMSAHFDLAIACDAVGGSQEIFAATLDYMKTRHQYNRPIASFQALKHRAADLKVAIEASRALVDSACRRFAQAQSGWEYHAACSRLYSGSVYCRVTEEAIQLHGGIGFTWQHDCHLYFKRARLNEVLGGTPEQRKDRIAPALFESATP